MKKRTAWIVLLLITAVMAAVVFLSVYREKKPFHLPMGEGAFRVKETVYDCGLFDFSETPENAPLYQHADGKLFWDAPHTGAWEEIGPLTAFEAERKDLEPYFRDAQGMWFGGLSVEEIYEYALWGALAENKYGFFLLLCLKNDSGDLMCRGFYEGRQPFVLWVERLESDRTPPATATPIDSLLPSTGAVLWVDRWAPGVDYGASFELTLPEYPGVTFICTPDEVTANGKRLISGMPVSSVYLADLTGDGKQELCASWALGSGIVNEGVTVYDYAADTAYILEDRMRSDFVFEAVDGALRIKKTAYMDRVYPPEEQQAEYGIPAIVDGRLVMIDTPISE